MQSDVARLIGRWLVGCLCLLCMATTVQAQGFGDDRANAGRAREGNVINAHCVGERLSGLVAVSRHDIQRAVREADVSSELNRYLVKCASHPNCHALVAPPTPRRLPDDAVVRLEERGKL